MCHNVISWSSPVHPGFLSYPAVSAGFIGDPLLQADMAAALLLYRSNFDEKSPLSAAPRLGAFRSPVGDPVGRARNEPAPAGRRARRPRRAAGPAALPALLGHPAMTAPGRRVRGEIFSRVRRPARISAPRSPSAAADRSSPERRPFPLALFSAAGSAGRADSCRGGLERN